MKNNYFFLLIIITLLLVMPMLLMLHGLFPRLDTDYDSNLPIYYFLTDYIRAHHTLPFSIPYVGTGISVLGDPLSAVLNPLFMLPLLLFGIEGGLKIVFLLLFLLSAITMWIFLSSLSLQKEIRLWGSLLYTFSGAFVARIAAGHIEKFLSYPLIPLFFLLAIKEDVTLVRCIGLAGIFTVILFSGDWCRGWVGSMFLVVVETYYFFTLTHRRTQRVLVFVLTYAFFIILSSPKLIPYLLFVRPHYARYYSIDPFLGSVHFFLEPLAFIMPFQAAFYDRPFLQRHVGFHYNWYEYYAFISPLPLLFLVKLKHLLSDQRVRLFLLLIFVSSLYLALKYTYSPYMLIFLQTLVSEGLQEQFLRTRDCRGKTSLSTRLDRYEKIVLPRASFLGQSTIGGTCFEHPLYKDPIPPGVFLEKDLRVCGTLDWIGQIPIMTSRCWMKRASAWERGALPTATTA